MLVYDMGTVVEVQSADTLSKVHRCGAEFAWQCPTCGCEPADPLRSARELRHNPYLDPVRDCDCGTRYEQIRVSALPV